MRGLLRTRDGQTTGLRNGESLRTDTTGGQSDDTDRQTEIGKEDREEKKTVNQVYYSSVFVIRETAKLESTKQRCVTVKRMRNSSVMVSDGTSVNGSIQCRDVCSSFLDHCTQL